jgi:hypothetical protein
MHTTDTLACHTSAQFAAVLRWLQGQCLWTGTPPVSSTPSFTSLFRAFQEYEDSCASKLFGNSEGPDQEYCSAGMVV